LGGFCALKGDDPSNPDEFHAKDSFISANLRRKLLIIVGGVTMNLLTAWVIFTFLFRYGTKPLGTSPLESESYLMPSLNFLKAEGFATGDIKPGVVIQEVMADSLAATIGLRAGDVVMQVNGENVSIGNLSELLKKTDGTAQLALTRENASPASRVQDFTCLDKDCKL
jgi:membrane-associated protease RseP (regulator of RpoE activity)